MQTTQQQIITISAKALFTYFTKTKGESKSPFCFDTRKKTLYRLVVKEENTFDECPMQYQLEKVIGKKCNFGEDRKFYDRFLIVDFEDIFMPASETAPNSVKNLKEAQKAKVKDLMENGLRLQFDSHTIDLMPFDKSGNMSRNSRISFIDKKLLKKMNKRLNLDIDFKNIKVVDSKYYAYRGLYLSSSLRVENTAFKITPETLIVVNDERKNSKGKPVLGPAFERNVNIETAEGGDEDGKWTFTKPTISTLEHIDIPFDGEGFITPDYSKIVNDSLKLEDASSYQVRLPFAKGMLHRVDVIEFINEFSKNEIKEEDKYKLIDAFGIERDLRKAKIILTESMFKGHKWLKEYCDKNPDFAKDPMKYYCDKLNEYGHSLYISGSDLPYGHSKYTRLSYQAINTLAFNDNEFDSVLNLHKNFIENPIKYIEEINDALNINEDNDEEKNIENDLECELKQSKKIKEQTWKVALLNNKGLAGKVYLKEQLENVQKSLLTNLARGKVLVKGQTRYLCRDLLPLLVSLLHNEKDIKGFYKRKLYERFYMPGKNGLDYKKNYAFFRNPHLSRNEQYMMKPFVLPKNKKDYTATIGANYEQYRNRIERYEKYFGHLTGIVMVPRGSTLPLCLGGADFDGDLVSVIFDQNVVNAVERGVYENGNRKLPEIIIPTVAAQKKSISDYVPYEHIERTFANRIGQISNAAISIGQIEYNKKDNRNNEFDAKKASCDKCTLLTGLEIDAAKNGLHPDLSIILGNDSYKKCDYLVFLDEFNKLKLEKDFHYEKIQIENKENKIVLSVPGSNVEVDWNRSNKDDGTYINNLPELFIERLKEYQKKKSNSDFVIDCKSNLKGEAKETLSRFEKECDDIISIYSFYNNDLYKRLLQEKKKGYYAVENIEIMVTRIYDADKRDDILYTIIPSIKEKIEAAIFKKKVFNKEVFNDIKKRINSEMWQFQPYCKRGKTLENIIGNGFKEKDLTEKEKSFLFQFNHQGYKMLWRIIELLEGPLTKDFDEIYDECNIEENENTKVLNQKLYELTKNFYDNNISNSTKKIYYLCLEEIENKINEYRSSFGMDKLELSKALYKKVRTSSKKAQFFWDTFSYEDIKGIMQKNEGK